MYAQFTAQDGIYLLGSESLVIPAGEDQIKGGNLLTNPHDSSNWTGANSGTPSDYESIGIKLTNTNPGVASGYAYYTITTDSSKWYLYRLKVSDPELQTTRIYAGTGSGNNSLGIDGFNTNEYKSVVFQGTGSTVYLHIQNYSAIQDSAYFSRIELLEITGLGVDETTELVTNGTFASDISSWTDASTLTSSIAWNASGYMDLICGGTGIAVAQQSITTVSGSVYKIEFDKVSATGTTTLSVGTTLGNNDIRLISGLSSAATYTYYFKASGTTTYLQLHNSSTSTTAQVDNVTCTLSGNLVTNGDYTDTTNTDFTLGADWSITGGQLVGSNGGGITTSAYETADIATNDILIITYTIVSLTGTGFRWKIGGTNSNLTTSRTAAGTYTETITLATLTNTRIETSVVGVTAVTIDNLEVRKAATDISSNGDGIEIHGEVTTVPVNFDADTVAWTNFSSINRLEQPYNSNLDYGVAGFHVRGWFRHSGTTTNEMICSYGYYTGGAWSGAAFEVYMNSSGNLLCKISDDAYSTSDTITSTATYDDNEWHQFTMIVTPDDTTTPTANAYLDLYVDGSSAATQVTVSSAVATLTNSSATFIIGNQQPLNGAFGGDIAEISTGTTIASAQDAKNFYNYEKPLFYQDSTYQVKGNLLGYEVDLMSESNSRMDSAEYSDSYDLSNRATTIKAKKSGYSYTTVKFLDTKKKYAHRFLSHTIGQSFTFDALGKEYASFNPLTVYKTSSGETISWSPGGQSTTPGGWCQFNFTVRETR